MACHGVVADTDHRCGALAVVTATALIVQQVFTNRRQVEQRDTMRPNVTTNARTSVRWPSWSGHMLLRTHGVNDASPLILKRWRRSTNS